MRTQLIAAAALLASTALLAGCRHDAVAAPSTDDVSVPNPDPSPQIRGWLTQMRGATTNSIVDYPTCDKDDANCLWYFPNSTSFRTPAGAVFCTAFDAPAHGTFNCAVRNAQFTLPTRPPEPHSQWHASDIRQGDQGWTIGNFVGQPSVALEANPLPYDTKLVLSHLKSPSGEAPRLECGSFTHGMVCLDHMSAKGFHASRDDFTPFSYPSAL
ncbi:MULTISPECIES: hypothetical protein [unclassified Mycobacterium]|uniref:hypothetical protein n=1 Tax=unclassified Mycobacterium TaxID=2642494 RepID=UPI003875E752